MTFRLAPALLAVSIAAAPAPAQAPAQDPTEDPPTAFVDDFDDPTTLEHWDVLRLPDGTDPHDQLDIDNTRPGWLTVLPAPDHAWYNDGMGPALTRTVTGDFLIETRVQTHSRNNPDAAPDAQYNSAGLIVRDPASARGSQNWLVVNVGRQAPATGTEVKTTTNSRSVLQLHEGRAHATLRLARIGSTIYALRRYPDDDAWTLIRTFARPDLPPTVQVGRMANGWTPHADLTAQYDYARISTPDSPDELTAE